MAYLIWRGTYSLTRQYQPGDVVYNPDDGISYVCVTRSLGIPPYYLESGFEPIVNFNISLLDGGEF
jgi:hypothetical protein